MTDQIRVCRAVSEARSGWINAAAASLRRCSFVTGAWLVGSLGSGSGDAFSDVDLIVAVDPGAPSSALAEPFAALDLPGDVLFTRPKPRNAPTGGAYLAVCLDLAGLPVVVDLYLWPSETAAVPAGGRVVYTRSAQSALPVSELEFMALLDRHRTADSTGADPGHPASVLLLVQLAAKYYARGDTARQRGIHRRLKIPDGAGPAVLHDLLETRISLKDYPQLQPAVAAAHRLLRHAGSGRPPDAPYEAARRRRHGP